jgi:zinc D-Ala-D-Ala carboxypeptidase
MKIYLLLLFTLSFNACGNTKPTNTYALKEEKIALATMDTTKIDLNFLMGKFDPAQNPNFVKIPLLYANREGMYLQKEVFDAFLKMYEAAKKDSVNLVIISATRNFDSQKGIWERKWDNLQTDKDILKAADKDIAIAKKILEFSSMPSTSRHHWGTDIDFNELNNEWFEEGEGKKLYDWLQKEGPKFGFYLVYTAKGKKRLTGYNEEKWHYTYKPLSKKYTLQARENLKDTMITGFKGDHTSVKLDIVKNYVLGINPDCY